MRTATPKSPWHVRPGSPARRMRGLLLSVIAVAVVLGGRCVFVQGFDFAGKAAAATKPREQILPATRGTITDRAGNVLAESIPAVKITADPTMVATNGLTYENMSAAQKLRAGAGAGIIAGLLAHYVGGDYNSYYTELVRTRAESGQENKYVVLADKVWAEPDAKLAAALEGLGYVGLFREQSPVRLYPKGNLAANVLGFMSFNDKLEAAGEYPWTGGEGLESALEEELAGVRGSELYESSPYGRIPSGTSVISQPRDGISYQLTLDAALQYMQDQALAASVKSSKSRSGMAITMNVKTGEILALSNYPTFDPNNYGASTQANLGNRAVRDAYEPGSVQKVLTMAALVDHGAAQIDTRVVVPGRLQSGGANGSVITDAWAHDTLHLTAAGVLAYSSNIGTAVMTRHLSKNVSMSKATLVEYLKGFGLGTKAGVFGLPGEATGSLPGADMADQTLDMIAFGQGLSVTAVQEAAAVAAVANGGVYITPRIVAAATTSDGKPVALPQQTVRRVVSAETSATVLRMMESVVAVNYYPGSIPGYRLAGKSGTAEAIDPKCKCYRGYYSSYVGVAPAENPTLLTYVVLDHPTNGSSGTQLASPVVRDILAVALPTFGVLTSTTKPPKTATEW